MKKGTELQNTSYLLKNVTTIIFQNIDSKVLDQPFLGLRTTW